MPRSVNHVASKARRKKILKLTRGYFGARKNVWTVAKNTWEKGLTYAFRDRKNKKRNFQREFEIKSKNSKLSVIDKIYVNGGLLFKKAVCRDSRQGVGYKVTE